jgi:hypothetical protein
LIARASYSVGAATSGITGPGDGISTASARITCLGHRIVGKFIAASHNIRFLFR